MARRLQPNDLVQRRGSEHAVTKYLEGDAGGLVRLASPSTATERGDGIKRLDSHDPALLP